jgi:isoleucyl-tRNA synthetase
VDAAWWPAPATSRGYIAGEILATSFEFGEPTDGIEIGEGAGVDHEGVTAR